MERAEKAVEALVYGTVGLALYVRDTAPSFIKLFVARGKNELGQQGKSVGDQIGQVRNLSDQIGQVRALGDLAAQGAPQILQSRRRPGGLATRACRGRDRRIRRAADRGREPAAVLARTRAAGCHAACPRAACPGVGADGHGARAVGRERRRVAHVVASRSPIEHVVGLG